MTKRCFGDLETTGLDHLVHETFEIALIVDDGEEVTEHEWWIEVDLTTADPTALRMNNYYARRADRIARGLPIVSAAEAAAEVAPILAGAVLIGANPAFDDRFLTVLLRRNGQCPAWHYRTFCVETAAAAVAGIEPPWGSSTEMCARALNVPPPSDADRHTGMGDCRWAKAVYDTVYHRPKPTRARSRNGAAPAKPERSSHPLISASPKAFTIGLANLDDPTILAHVLEDAVAEGISAKRIEAIRARLAETDNAEAEPDTEPDAEEEAGDIEIATGRPAGMPAEDDRPPCEVCGKETEGPSKPGAPSAAQLSWTRYRRVLCFADLENMKVVT